MFMSRLGVAVLGGVLLMGGAVSAQADSDRGKHTRSQLIQHDSRDRHAHPGSAPHRRDWQDNRRGWDSRDHRQHRDYGRHDGRGQFEHRGSYERRDYPGAYGQFRYDSQPYRVQGQWSLPQNRLGNERGESFNSERYYPDSPGVKILGTGRGYAPPTNVLPDMNRIPPRNNPHPPGIYRPLHDGGLNLPPPR